MMRRQFIAYFYGSKVMAEECCHPHSSVIFERSLRRLVYNAEEDSRRGKPGMVSSLTVS
jgi:hypothetical protein